MRKIRPLSPRLRTIRKRAKRINPKMIIAARSVAVTLAIFLKT
jgi:hypothetical protein